MRSLYLEMFYTVCFSRQSREKKKQVKGLRPFDPVFVCDSQMKILCPFELVFPGSLRASTAGAQPSVAIIPLLGGGRGWAHG
jgi:hypothetical protein